MQRFFWLAAPPPPRRIGPRAAIRRGAFMPYCAMLDVIALLPGVSFVYTESHRSMHGLLASG